MYDALSLGPDNRRLSPRLPLRTYMNQYVRDDPYQALALDVSETGPGDAKADRAASRTPASSGWRWSCPGPARSSGPAPSRASTPSTRETHFSGLHFLAMARKHERLIRDYVRERRERWLRLFSPRPIYVSRFGCRFS